MEEKVIDNFRGKSEICPQSQRLQPGSDGGKAGDSQIHLCRI